MGTTNDRPQPSAKEAADHRSGAAKTDHASEADRETEENADAVTMVVPAHPPVVTPAVARVLLRIFVGVRDNQS